MARFDVYPNLGGFICLVKNGEVEQTNAKALLPWYKKKRFWILGFIGVAVIGSLTSQSESTTTTPEKSAETQVESTQVVSGSTEAEESNSSESAGQKNARKSAESYLDYQAFSRTGLIKQLEFEGYLTEDSTYGVDSLDADWHDQAAQSAKSYLEYSSFSRSGLFTQLLFEGFTQSQAEWG